MNDPAGLVVVLIVVLCLGYMVPSLIRQRKIVASVHADERFSPTARVVEHRAEEIRLEISSRPATTGLLGKSRNAGSPGMNRPYASIESGRSVRGASAVSAKLTSQRAAAARRRALIAAAFGLLSIFSWVLVPVAGLGWYVALLPTVLFGGVLALGRRAVVLNERADTGDDDSLDKSDDFELLSKTRIASDSTSAKADAQTKSHAVVRSRITADLLELAPEPERKVKPDAEAGLADVTPIEVETTRRIKIHDTDDDASPLDMPASGRATRSGAVAIETGTRDGEGASISPEQLTQKIARTRRSKVAVDPHQSAALSFESHFQGQVATASEWQPVEVPQPAYSLKALAPRWEAKATDGDASSEQADAFDERQSRAGNSEDIDLGNGLRVPGRMVFSSGGLDLDAALERRRKAASGE